MNGAAASDARDAAPPSSSGFSSAEPASSMPLPRVFGRLLLLKLIARGGMGDVYLAATTGIEGAERACVVKTVRRDHIHDGSFLARFLDEARVQSQLNHPGVAQVLEAATDENGEPYTVVEHVEGRSLSEVRQRAIQLGNRIAWPEAVAIAIEMAQALAHVHERSGPDGSPLQIVHRDLSPQNVMIGYAGEVKLIDFGTARGHNRRCHTVAGVVFAKPGYVAPEVARQQVGDARIDLYALGVMLWELAAGRRFFNGGDPQKHLEDAADGKVHVPLIARSVDAPELLDDIIGRLTANDPDERFASASRAVPELAKLLGMAPAHKGERGVRARVGALMKMLWPQEPSKSRAEFARLLREARDLRREPVTPSASLVMERISQRMAPEDPDVLAGTPYRIGRIIGEGASGVVYEAEHMELGRKLAIKILSPEHAAASDAVERFRREARAVAQLSHPNLALLYDFGKSLDGRVFLAMELLKGETVDKKMKREGIVGWREAVKLGVDVCKALEAAHLAKLVHRDIKPANLFVTREGQLKLLDFGVAMALADTAPDDKRSSSSAGASDGRDPVPHKRGGFAIFGTPEYMAPEQVAGEAVDARCDLYALGCVLYELVTGVTVFEGTSGVVVMGKQLRETPESPRVRAPAANVPRELDAVIVKALAKKPIDRFPNATQMREALEATLAGERKRATQKKRVMTAVVTLGAMIAAGTAASRYVPGALGDPGAPVAQAASLAPVQTQTQAQAQAQAQAPTQGQAQAQAQAPDAPPEDATRAERERVLLDFRAHAKEHGSDPAALRAWAWAAYRAGEMREARRAAHAWALHDGTAEPRMFLSMALDAVGRHAEAKAVLEEWLELHPDADDVKKALAKLDGNKPAVARK